MQRAPELEALAKADDPVVADRAVRRNQLFGGGILILFGLVAGYFVVAGQRTTCTRHAGRRRGVHDHDLPPALFRPRWRAASLNQPSRKIARIAPPPPPPPAPPKETVDTTEFDVPPPPPPAQTPPPETTAERPGGVPGNAFVRT